jgi:hypothetical protein
LALAGCANHIRYVDASEEHHDLQVRSTAYMIESHTPVIETDLVQLRLFKLEVDDDKAKRSTTKFDEFTPYEGARELYEVPLGIVCIPVALLANVGRVLTFGMIPGQAVDNFTSWAFTAVNPFMNAADPTRVQTRPVSTVTSDGEVKETRVETPLEQVNVAVNFDDYGGRVMKTDSKGQLDFDLLDVITESLATRPRKLVVSTPNPAGGSEEIRREFFIERELAARVYEARNHVLAYRNGPRDAATLGEAVAALDRLQFKDYSLTLEDKIVNEFGGDEAFMIGFRQTLDRYYATSQPQTGDASKRTATTENPRVRKPGERAAE